MEISGAYTTERAAALSGVPKSTAYYWARKGHLLPSVSQKPLLWSYTDLLALRTIYWLRQPKSAFEREVPATSMSKVRRALRQLKELDLDLFSTVGITLAGEIAIDADALPLQLVDGQYLERALVNIVGPFEGLEGTKGPDLLWPRPTVQILPGKISGAPHITGTRVPTQSIDALASRGFSVEQLAKIYPFVSRESLCESIDLETQLKRNSALTRAA
ncbi:MAG TPA: DUF433 domain-containing protein [Thermoanaerobaculia bacterium]|jgi:uncharacterized protein (DUF433 family)/DNA-binding transcriptional MerR regulator|nr:DUF433 domain-containing protein [Thermoanaerobaculia bacterium]